MSKKTLGTIIGINTAITGAVITCVPMLWPEKSQIINGVVEAVSGCINGVCLVFMKNGNLPDKTAK